MSNHINKPRQLREAIGLSPTDCGRILLGIDNHKRAYDTWAKMERDNAEQEKLSNSMRQYINLLLMLDKKTLDTWIANNGQAA